MDLSQLPTFWPFLVGLLTLAAALLAGGHAVLFKRDVRAAIAWVVVISFLPLVGAIFYLLFGINRIRRRARALRGLPKRDVALPLQPSSRSQESTLEALEHFLDRTVPRRLVDGNSVELLENGDIAYPAMLEAIDRAEKTVAFCTYIFDSDRAGRLFHRSLKRAVDRGVEVRVLIDAAGNRYSWPSMARLLRKDGIATARHLPATFPRLMPFLNLRNHRKLLVVDGSLAYTGGMNIREGNLLELQSKHPVQDVHFELRGPIVHQLQDVFADDWAFTTGERLEGRAWFPELDRQGTVRSRAVADGPDEDLGRLRWARLAALACARERVRIVTPYFLPTADFIAAMTTAARRGVEVEIVMPSENNLPLVQWASTALLWQVLEGGCKIWQTASPFDHSKIVVVDGIWSLIGSANWDPRSFRLNFELDVECHGEELAGELDTVIDRKLVNARRITLEDVDARALPIRLRDGLARLLVPFL